MDPKISVLIPAFNVASTIHDTVYSVLRQTEPSWEIVVADDGSTDTTVKIVEGIQAKSLQGDKIRIVRLKHGGCASATHQGILRCRSEIITILDGDDMIYPTALTTVLRNLRVATCYLWTRFRTSHANNRAHAAMGWAANIPSQCSTLKETFLTTNWWAASHQRVFRRATYLSTSGLDMRWQTAADLQLALLFAGTGLPTQSVDAVTYWWRKSSGQMSAVLRPQQKTAHLEMLHEWRVRHGS